MCVANATVLQLPWNSISNSTLERNHLNVKFVAKPFLRKVHVQHIKKFTQGRSLSNALGVQRPSVWLIHWEDMNAFILGRNRTNVTSVDWLSVLAGIWRGTSVSTLERSLSAVMFVGRDLVRLIMWKLTCKCIQEWSHIFVINVERGLPMSEILKTINVFHVKFVILWCLNGAYYNCLCKLSNHVRFTLCIMVSSRTHTWILGPHLISAA